MGSGLPPRPSSQPKAYPDMPPRSAEAGGRVHLREPYHLSRSRQEDPLQFNRPRPEDEYNMNRPPPGHEYNPERVGLRPYPYDDRAEHADRMYQMDMRHQEQQNYMEQQRDREQRQRQLSGSDSSRHAVHYAEFGHREPPRTQTPYGRPPEHRDVRDPRDSRDPREAQWGPGPDPSYRAPMDHQRPHPEYNPVSSPYPPHGPAYQTAPPERYPPASGAHPTPPQNSSSAPPQQPFDSPDRARMSAMHPQHPQQQQQQPHRLRPGEEAHLPPSIAYNSGHGPAPYDSPKHRGIDDVSAHNSHQRNLLGFQEINRKGRISPLPQAVQGAQPQQPGPAGEPGIKSEFGRMFAGIGSGVSAIGVSSPITSGAPVPYLSSSSTKREDVEHSAPEPAPEPPAKAPKGRRRKLKDEDSKDDESSGRLTPVSRAKRPKTHQHHHHQYVPRNLANNSSYTYGSHSHHHHHHHHPNAEPSSVSGAAALKSLKAGIPGSAAGEKGSAVTAHHHHHHGPPARQPLPGSAPRPTSQASGSTIPPKTKTTVSSKAVLDAVALRPRHHLGDFIYEAGLRPGRLVPHRAHHRGFSSNPKPLPWETIRGKENCTITVKVARVHLSPLSREEITSRAFLWGTDVYSDDSDVVAACIHSGWIKGEWAEDFDASMLDLDHDNSTNKRRKTKNQGSTVDLESEGLISSPPTSGPMSIPANRDLHVNLLILPRLHKYAATTRHGISSREFGGEYGSRHAIHDGASYMIKSVRWVENGAQPQARLRGKARRERMRRAMAEVKCSFSNVNGQDRDQDKDHAGKLRGDISGNWWRRSMEANRKDKENEHRAASEGDKENLDAAARLEEEMETEKEDMEMEMEVEMNEETTERNGAEQTEKNEAEETEKNEEEEPEKAEKETKKAKEQTEEAEEETAKKEEMVMEETKERETTTEATEEVAEKTSDDAPKEAAKETAKEPSPPQDNDDVEMGDASNEEKDKVQEQEQEQEQAQE